MLTAVAANLGQVPEQALADAGYRSEAVFEQLAGSDTELVVALGREGKRCTQIDARTHPRTAAMAAKLQTKEGKAAYVILSLFVCLQWRAEHPVSQPVRAASSCEIKGYDQKGWLCSELFPY